MSNPFSNPQTPSWVERVIGATRDALRRMNLAAYGAKSSRGWTIALVVCALLVGGISLTSIANKRQSQGSGTMTVSAAPETKAVAAPTKLQEKPSAKSGEKKAPASVKSGQIKRASKAEEDLEKRTEAGIRQRAELQLSPGGVTAKVGEGLEETGDEVRARANWFFDQRAYPFQHIPSGALQEAIKQRDLMKQQQKAAGARSLASNAVINFPGDALWHLTGPQPINEPFSVNSGFPTASGRVTAIAVDPSDATGQTVLIGGAAGGVWKTTNGGTTWTPLTDTQPSLSIGSIAIDPNNHLNIYVGTGEENFSGDAYYGAGILKSTDGGLTWAQIGASTFARVLGPGTGGAFIGGIAVQPGNSNVVLASISYFVGGTIGGIYRSTDAGVTWNEVSAGSPPIGIAGTGLVFDSGTPTTVYAAMGYLFGETANGIYRSTDSGVTWSKLATGLPASGANTGMGRVALAIAPSTTGPTAVLYAAIADAASGSSSLLGFFTSTNGGISWTQLGATPAFCNQQCWYDITVAVHPTNPNFVVVGGGAFTNNSSTLFKTTDGGATWTDFTLGSTNVRPHVDTHAFGFAATGGTPRFYVGNDGGVWRTDDPTPAAPLWVDLNTTLALTQFYPGPSAGIGDENYGFGGTQDNDTDVFSGTLDWTNVFACGDGGFTAIDSAIPTTVYTTCDSGAGAVVAKSVFNGAVLPGPSPTFSAADSGIVRTDRSQFIPPLAIDPNTGSTNTLYFGTCRVFKTTDGGATWNPFSGDLSIAGNPATTCPGVAGNPTITNIEVSQQSSQLVVAGTSNGLVWESTTGGALWNQIDSGLLPPRYVTAVRTKRSDTTGKTVYVTFSGFGACSGCGTTPGHVFKTTDGGVTWKNLSGDLPDAPVNDIIVDHEVNPTTFDALYIATDVGVFSCPDPEAATPCQNWTVIGDGLPNAPVLGLAMRPSSRILRAFTHGRSAWHTQLTDSQPPSVAVLSSVTPGAVHVGDPTTLVTFTGLNLSPNTQIFFDGVNVGAPTLTGTTQMTVNVKNPPDSRRSQQESGKQDCIGGPEDCDG